MPKYNPRPDTAEFRIEEARLSGATTLDLSRLGLTELPAAVERLSQLEMLILTGNMLTELPPTIEKLTRLESLQVSTNKLRALPEGLGNLANLRVLNAEGNSLDTLPESIGRLKKLKALALYGNRLNRLPDSLGELPELERLDLEVNELTALPESIGRLPQLERLSVAENRLTSLPASMMSLARLRYLFLHDNDALQIPPEILGPTEGDVSLRGATPAIPSVILQYYFNARRGPARRLGEAKVLIVGQGGVGKTSLVKRLVHGEYDPHELKTEGIQIASWQVPGKPAKDGKAEPIRLNLWDFGGQEIMHATHQFFLTKRSLYLVVLDARKGENESNIHYWLKIIQSYGGDAPVLIVTNKSEPPNHLDLNESRLLKDYAPNLKGFVKVSCQTGAGIAELRAQIEALIGALPHVDDRVPASYFAVKEKLAQAAHSKNFITFGEYEALCTESGVTDARDREILIRFLHDLGTVLNFHDPESPYGATFRDTNILNPEWVTGGVYKILNSNALMQRQGVLTLSELDAILDDQACYPLERQRFIIDMMRKFELCFEFPDSGGQKLLVPELLPPNEPDIGWTPEEALNFEYHYSVLPSGLILRFIVKMHHNLTKKPTYWRSGVVLDIDGSRTLVRADTQAARIYVSITGKKEGRRRALSVVRDAFRSIHASIPKLDVSEKVPLPDDPRVAVDYIHLLKLEERGTPSFLPEGADRDYSVEELLEGIEEKSRRQERSRAIKRAKDGERSPRAGKTSKPAPPPEPTPVRRPSVSGAFYLLAFVIVLAALTAVSIYVPWYALIPVLLVSVLVLPVLGALQLKNDDRFKDESFIELIKEAYKTLPLLKSSGGEKTPSPEPKALDSGNDKAAPPQALPPAKDKD